MGKDFCDHSLSSNKPLRLNVPTWNGAFSIWEFASQKEQERSAGNV